MDLFFSEYSFNVSKRTLKNPHVKTTTCFLFASLWRNFILLCRKIIIHYETKNFFSEKKIILLTRNFFFLFRSIIYGQWLQYSWNISPFIIACFVESFLFENSIQKYFRCKFEFLPYIEAFLHKISSDSDRKSLNR